LNTARIYRALVLLARPFLWVTNRMAYGLLRVVGVVRAEPASQTLSTEELRTVVAEAGPLIPARHRQMLLSILDLERVTVNDIMIQRQDIAGIDISGDWEDVLERLRHMKRTAQEFARGTLTRERLIELAAAREPYFVPEGTSLMQQLAQFQRN